MIYDCKNSDKIAFRDRAGKYYNYKALIKQADKSASKFTVGWNIESTVTFNDKRQQFRIATHTVNRECRRYLAKINHKEIFPIGTKAQIHDYKNQQWANTEIIKQRYGRVLEIKKVNYISKNCCHCDELNEFRLDSPHKVDKLQRKKIWQKIQSPTATAQNLRIMAGVSGAGISGINCVDDANGNGVGRVPTLHRLNRIRGLNFGALGLTIVRTIMDTYAGGDHRNLNHRNHSNHDSW